jgi:hypothetical protein
VPAVFPLLLEALLADELLLDALLLELALDELLLDALLLELPPDELLLDALLELLLDELLLLELLHMFGSVVGSHAHVPPLHVVPAPQTLAQAPQLLGSLVVSTQLGSQKVGSLVGQHEMGLLAVLQSTAFEQHWPQAPALPAVQQWSDSGH